VVFDFVTFNEENCADNRLTIQLQSAIPAGCEVSVTFKSFAGLLKLDNSLRAGAGPVRH